jgi:sialate O-acetylesterase
MRLLQATLLSLSLAFLSPLAAASLELPGVFSDHMVLQQGKSLPVWGMGTPGASVTVHIGQDAETVPVGPDGTWRVTLPAQAVSFEHVEFKIESSTGESLSYADVLIGEVWFASGQSNMTWAVQRSLDGDMEAVMAHHPNLRILDIDRVASTEPRFSSPRIWQTVSAESIPSFSAVTYTFGRDLQAALRSPIGLIHSSWYGTPAIAWTRESALPNHPLLAERAAEWEAVLTLPEAETENLLAGVNRRRVSAGSSQRPGVLANGMVAPVAPYAIAGAIWYQGEGDANWEPELYGERLAVMIEDWRAWWELPEMPFGIVQLAGFMQPKTAPSNDPWPRLRESQRVLARTLPHTGLAVAIDIGEVDDIHPFNKHTVGRRLARWALADVYGLLELRGGPEIAAATFDEEGITLTFTQIGGGLRPFNGNPLLGFTVAGEDGVFYFAEAEVTAPDTVLVKLPEGVTEATHVRYAWQNNPVEANLYNLERHPASPFEVRR